MKLAILEKFFIQIQKRHPKSRELVHLKSKLLPPWLLLDAFILQDFVVLLKIKVKLTIELYVKVS